MTHGENGRYSPSMNLTSSSLGHDTSFREELSVAQRLNLQVSDYNIAENYTVASIIILFKGHFPFG